MIRGGLVARDWNWSWFWTLALTAVRLPSPLFSPEPMVCARNGPSTRGPDPSGWLPAAFSLPSAPPLSSFIRTRPFRLASTMTACTRCAKIALETFPEDETLPVLAHSQSVLVLLKSAETCPLCRYFLSLFQEKTIREFERDAKQGIRTRTVLRTLGRWRWARVDNRMVNAENRMIQREYVLVSPTRDVASSERFVIGSSGGWFCT